MIKLSPIHQRQCQRFQANRRGVWSLRIFLLLFCITLVAEVIANDKPIILKYKGEFYFPVAVYYSETTFGGDFDTEADYRDSYVQELIENEGEGWMLWPLIPYSYQTINYHLEVPAPSPPTVENWLGTDDQGRDVLARVIYGFRISVFFGLMLTAASAVIGVIAGALQGFIGGWFDLLFQRFIEIWGSMPQLFLLMILSSFITPTLGWLLLVMLLFGWMGFVGVVRAECLKTRRMDYVTAARTMGVGEWRILFRHVLPNSLVATLTFMPFVLNGSITTLTALDFLGFGLPPGSASLGELLAQGKANIEAPWLGMTGFIVIALLLTLLIFIGEAVRDALDPRKG